MSCQWSQWVNGVLIGAFDGGSEALNCLLAGAVTMYYAEKRDLNAVFQTNRSAYRKGRSSGAVNIHAGKVTRADFVCIFSTIVNRRSS